MPRKKLVLYLDKVMKAEHTMDLKSYMDYRHRPPYCENNQDIVYLGNRKNQAQDIKLTRAVDARNSRH